MGQMETFNYDSGDDWPTYVERLEQFFTPNGATEEEKKVAVLVTVMGAKAYGLLQNLVAPDKPTGRKFDNPVQKMKDHLNPKPLAIIKVSQVRPKET